MISFKPRSILQLTITGFLLVTGVLIVALVVSVKQLNGLSSQSQQIISKSAAAMQLSRTLTEQASAMERNALQYEIVGDREILDVYSDRRDTFGRAAQQLSTLSLGVEMVDLINSLITNEALAYRVLPMRDGNSGDENQALYPRLLETTYRISELVNQWTNQSLIEIQQETTETQNLLLVQAVLLTSFALLLAGIFTTLITRPLSQMEKGINQLGSGLYDESISVKGPKDLANLGSLLDWLRNRLKKLEQQRSSFFRHVSHELKTPLAAIHESSSLLNDEIAGELNDEQLEIIRIQKNNCQRLQTLIDDLLRYNSDSFSVLNAMPLPVRLDRVVDKVVGMHELIIRACNLKIEKQLAKVIVKGIEEQFRVIIDNLLINAIKFSPNESTITLTTGEKAGMIYFEIRDQGPGILESERDRVFDPFYQSTPPAEKEFLKGSGLGLTIVSEYTHANGGEIAILDHSGGAHFQLCFPLCPREESA